MGRFLAQETSNLLIQIWLYCVVHFIVVVCVNSIVMFRQLFIILFVKIQPLTWQLYKNQLSCFPTFQLEIVRSMYVYPYHTINVVSLSKWHFVGGMLWSSGCLSISSYWCLLSNDKMWCTTNVIVFEMHQMMLLSCHVYMSSCLPHSLFFLYER